jgi:hypothetical protein
VMLRTKCKLTCDWSPKAIDALEEVCSLIECQPLHLLQVMSSESGLRADAHNDTPKNRPPEQRYNASGLIQFLPVTLRNLGWTKGHADFRKLSPEKQMPFVRDYFLPWKRKKLSNAARLYVAVFVPAMLALPDAPDTVLIAKGGRLGWAYEANSAAFDRNNDRTITIGEMQQAIERNSRIPRFIELADRLGAVGDTPTTTIIDLGTVLGVQEALSRIGIDPGPLDGYVGPKTRAAITQFQTEHPPLAADGVFGPLTRNELTAALQSSA